MKLSPHEIAFVAQWAGFSGDDLTLAVAVALAESGGDTDIIARSDSGASVGNRDHGLWQISGRWHGDKLAATALEGLAGGWRNPYANAHLAFEIYTEAGRKFTPWAAFNSAAHERYLPDARIAVKQPVKPRYP